jgi:hypothetical protein
MVRYCIILILLVGIGCIPADLPQSGGHINTGEEVTPPYGYIDYMDHCQENSKEAVQ